MCDFRFPFWKQKFFQREIQKSIQQTTHIPFFPERKAQADTFFFVFGFVKKKLSLSHPPKELDKNGPVVYQLLLDLLDKMTNEQ